MSPSQNSGRAGRNATSGHAGKVSLNGNGAVDQPRVSRPPAGSSRLAHTLRRVCLVGIYGGTLFLCRWLAYQVRFDFEVPVKYQVQLDAHWIWVIPSQLLWLLVFGQFSGIYKYFSIPEIRRLAYAMILSGLTLLGVSFLQFGFAPPRGVVLLQCMCGFLALGGLRTCWRLAHERYLSRHGIVSKRMRKVAIIGAGDAGADLARELYARPYLGMVPVAFFDDAPHKWGSNIHRIPVIGSPELIARRRNDLELEEVVIAMPSAPAHRIGEVVALLQQAGLKYATVPGIDQLTSGAVQISQLRPVKIEDLLGRETIDLHLDAIGGVLKDRVVLVSGAGGSIGAELCRQIAAFGPRCLLLIEQSEVQLFLIEQQLIKLGYGKIIVPVIADVLDRPRMDTILGLYRPALIFHAAAHKHVTMMEIQPCEAIKNNALATVDLAQLAAAHGVERFVMISTDKAVNPTSVMGASKRLAEVFLQAFAREFQGQTKFAAVRFGNVLGSSGSVVPIFERQIAEGGPVTVTHPEVVRFFMTIPEAVGLVLQTCTQGEGGEIFVLDMGKPVKIAELARQMIRLSGLEPDRDIPIEYVGLRPGEKLYEELHHLQANCTGTAHPRIMRLTSEPVALGEIRAQLHGLSQALYTASTDELKIMLQEILPEYMPALSAGNHPLTASPLSVRGIKEPPDRPFDGAAKFEHADGRLAGRH